jgi:DNA-binding GntR family transcriptional regulator
MSRQRPSAGKKPASKMEKTPTDGSVVEKIIARIKLNIRNGGYAPGQRLIEADVQHLTGASRGPVREAMRRLAAEGLLEILHQKGARIRKLTREQVEQLYDVREVIEGLAARQAALQFNSPAFRKGLSELEKQFARDYDGSPQTYMNYNERFHEFIVEHSNNAHLERLHKGLQISIVMLRLFSAVDREFVTRAHREHLEITRYLLRGEGAKAERAMRKHVRSTKATVLAKAHFLSD